MRAQRLILLCLAFSAAIGSEGCISYKNDQCVLCDTSSNYYNVNGTCSKKNLSNCMSSDNGEECALCIKDYYVLYTTKACFAVTPGLLKDQCIFYIDDGECSSCEKSYFVSNGKCVKVTQEIENCDSYASATQCKTCVDGYILTDDSLSCVDLGIDNCMSLGSIQCVSCVGNSLYFDNSYLYQFNIETNDRLKRIDIYNIQDIFFTTCMVQDVDNCLTFEEFYKCGQCVEGYYLDESYKCKIIPDEPIANCFEYKEKGVCTECLGGYYLKSSSECAAHSKTINFCKKMSMLLLDICTSCEDSYYLDAGICIERSLTVSGCLTYSITTDACSDCETIYLVNEGGTKCFKKYDNCSTHTATTEYLTCVKCNASYYWNTRESRCSKVTSSVDGCEYYSVVENPAAGQSAYTCATCLNKYYKNASGGCTANDDYVSLSLSCKTFSSTIKNTCTTCPDDKSKLFPVTNYCSIVSPAFVDNYCTYYQLKSLTDSATNITADTIVCETCKSTYYLVSLEYYCQKISITSCETAKSDGIICDTCSSTILENYFPNKNVNGNKCIQTYDFVTDSCYKTIEYATIDDLNYNQCNSCYSPYYPEIFSGTSFCVPKSQLAISYEGQTAASVNTLGVETTISIATSISGCIRFAPESLKCLECEFDTVNNSKKVLRNDSCTSACGTDEVPILTSNSQNFICITSKIKCDLLTSTTLCARCENPSVSIIDSSFGFNTFTTYAYLPAQETQHFKAKSLSYESTFNFITVYNECLAIDVANGLKHSVNGTNETFTKDKVTANRYPIYQNNADWSATSSYLKYCKAFYRFSNSPALYGCVMCQFGFTGYYVTSTSSSYQFIPQCGISTECDYGVYYMGIGSNLGDSTLDFWVGCHKCNNSSLIVTFSRKARAGYITTGLPSATSGEYYPQTSCQVPGIVTNSQFPANCAVQQYAPSENLQVYLASLGTTIPNPRCSACFPGYKPTIETISSTAIITACSEITNCDIDDGLTTFNKCTRCKIGYAINKNRDTCLLNAVSDCYEAFLDASSNNVSTKCAMCTEGYITIRDFTYCNKVNLSNCLIMDFFTLSDVAVDKPYTGAGCKECDLGYVATKFAVTQKVCVYSKQIEDRVNGPVRIENCKLYNGYHSCAECDVGYVLPQNTSIKCIISSKVSNCARYDSNEDCISCNSKYILMGPICEDGSKYIPNCLVFTSPTVCATCEDLYVPISANNITMCYYAGTAIQNCLKFDSDSSVSGTIKCKTCRSGYYPAKITDENIKTCVSIPAVSNCSTYTSIGVCIKCINNFYLKITENVDQINLCVQRKASYDNCSVRKINADVCETCDKGYYVRNGTCSIKPTGVIGCALYQDDKTCLKCVSGQYLTGNVCRKIPAEDLIEKCLYYKDAATCSDCDTSYLLVSNGCAAILISNCEVYIDEKTCQICKSQYFITDQKTCKAGSISFCVLYSSLTECSLCKPDYYPGSSGECLPIEEASKITNCNYYDTDQMCIVCKTSFILSKDSKKCSSFNDFGDSDPRASMEQNNCDNYMVNYYCRVCNAGYKMVSGTCKPCNSLLEGCYFCDPLDDSVCHVCMAGYYMDSTTNNKCKIIDKSGADDDYDEPLFPNCADRSKFFQGLSVIILTLWIN